MKALLILPLLMVLLSCNKFNYKRIFSDPQIYSNTVHELNNVVMGNNFTPVVASRNYAYANIAAYEIIAASDTNHYRSLAGQLNGLLTTPKPIKGKDINFGYAAVLAFCKVGESVTFPAGSMKTYTDSLHNVAIASGMPSATIKDSEAFASTMALAIMEWSKTDNYQRTRNAVKYTVKDTDGRWVPTPPSYADAVEPHWKEIRPMVMTDASQYRVLPPPAFNIKDTTSTYYHEVTLIKNTVSRLTVEQANIADFWDDNPGRLNQSGHFSFVSKKFSPPGHWMSITGIGAKKIHADFNLTVCAYTKTAIALFDAFIECWAAKYQYNTARPETVINRYLDVSWRPHLQTPPFPEYTCGHCVISAAAAETLSSVYGDNIAYQDTSELEFGIGVRKFTSFRQAASETALSRFYGGIHFLNSCRVSAACGKQLGTSIVSRLEMKINK